MEFSDYRQKGHDLKVTSQDFTNLLVTDDMWWRHKQQTNAVEILEEHSQKMQRKWTGSWLSRKWKISQWSKKGNSYITELHFGQMKYSMAVICVNGTEVEKCMFCPMNSCLEQAIVKLMEYEHNYFIFSQFVWSDRKYAQSKSEHEHNHFKRKHFPSLTPFLLSAIWVDHYLLANTWEWSLNTDYTG